MRVTIGRIKTGQIAIGEGSLRGGQWHYLVSLPLKPLTDEGEPLNDQEMAVLRSLTSPRQWRDILTHEIVRPSTASGGEPGFSELGAEIVGWLTQTVAEVRAAYEGNELVAFLSDGD